VTTTRATELPDHVSLFDLREAEAPADPEPPAERRAGPETSAEPRSSRTLDETTSLFDL
jgi:hypothetical protein